MIQPEDGGRIIRLNQEARGTALMRANRPIQKGEQLLVSDMQNFVSFDLDEEELDAGHFTLFWTGNGWIASFDFRAGRAKSAAMLKAAGEFLQVAILASTHGHTRPCVDNLFSACELVSKAHLVLHRSSASAAKSHGSVQSAIVTTRPCYQRHARRERSEWPPAGCSPDSPCAVRRRRPSAGANPARQLSLQPVAVGAGEGGNDVV